MKWSPTPAFKMTQGASKKSVFLSVHSLVFLPRSLRVAGGTQFPLPGSCPFSVC